MKVNLYDNTTFDAVARAAQAFSKSSMVPDHFKGNPANCLVAIDLANHMGLSPTLVMKNLNEIRGRMAWSSPFICGMIAACPKFKPLRFRYEGEGDDRTCVAWTTPKDSDDVLEGAPVSLAMARKEGWTSGRGSKWITMPDLMLKYRAATFFARLYAPETLGGFRPEDEEIDIQANNGQQESKMEIPTVPEPEPTPSKTAETMPVDDDDDLPMDYQPITDEDRRQIIEEEGGVR